VQEDVVHGMQSKEIETRNKKQKTRNKECFASMHLDFDLLLPAGSKHRIISMLQYSITPVILPRQDLTFWQTSAISHALHHLKEIIYFSKQ